MIADKDRLRSDRNVLERGLKDAGCDSIRGNIGKCPFHDDKHPSGSIYQGDDGAWRFKCHVPTCGFHGDVFDVMARSSGKSVEDLLREHSAERKPQNQAKPIRIFPTIQAIVDSVGAYSTVEDHFVYANPSTGAAELVIVRSRNSEGKKTFLQARPEAGGFAMKAPPKPWPLYNRTRAAAADVVIVVEGEKCVKALHAAGHVATTSPGGAENARNADWSPLSGKRAVYLWRDNDAAGEKYMREVAEELQRLPEPPPLLWIQVEEYGLPEKGDIVEYLQLFGGETVASKSSSIECAKQLAISFGPSSAVEQLIERTIDGRRYAVDLPWHGMNRLTNALLPACIAVLCGEAGASKSFGLLQWAIYFLKSAVKFALYQLESDEEGSHLLRAIVQESGRPELLDPRWVKENPDESRAILKAHRSFADAFGLRLTTPPNQPPTLDDLLKWIRARVDEGCRVIMIDPITAAEGSEKPWADDHRFILAAQAIMRESGASLVLVTHPRKGTKGSNISGDDMAGGAAYRRFSQTIFWVRKHDPAKLVRCRSAGGECSVEINRSVKIIKARLGKGGGLELGYVFGRSMQFAEQGVIVNSKVKEAIEEQAAVVPQMNKSRAKELAKRLCNLFPGQMNAGHRDLAIHQFQSCSAETVEAVISEWYSQKKPFDLPSILAACKEPDDRENAQPQEVTNG